MARRTGKRTIQCYLCQGRFEVSWTAQSTSCPHCHKPVIVEDLILKKNKPKLLLVSKVQTCGKIVVPKGARIGAELIEAHQGLEMRGVLQAKQVRGGPVIIGATAEWRGNLNATLVTIELGAKIKEGQFNVPDDELGIGDLLDKGV